MTRQTREAFPWAHAAVNPNGYRLQALQEEIRLDSEAAEIDPPALPPLAAVAARRDPAARARERDRACGRRGGSSEEAEEREKLRRANGEDLEARPPPRAVDVRELLGLVIPPREYLCAFRSS